MHKTSEESCFKDKPSLSLCGTVPSVGALAVCMKHLLCCLIGFLLASTSDFRHCKKCSFIIYYNIKYTFLSTLINLNLISNLNTDLHLHKASACFNFCPHSSFAVMLNLANQILNQLLKIEYDHWSTELHCWHAVKCLETKP